MKMVYGLIPLFIAALDQWIKYLVRSLPDDAVFFRLPGVFELIPSLNTGAAFSLLHGNNAVLTIVSAALMLFLAVYIKKTMRLTKPGVFACLILLGGGVGNWIDRAFFGGVTDYIRLLFIDFPIFNLADIAITGSVFVLIVLMLTDRLEETTGEDHGRYH